MEKPAQTPNGAPHRRRRRRPAGSGAPQAAQAVREGKAPAAPRKPAPQNAAPAKEGAPRAGGRPRRGQGRPAAPAQQPLKQNAPAPRAQAPQPARPTAPQPPRRSGRPAPQTPSRPVADQPKAPRAPRAARQPRSTAPEQPGLDLISRRPPKQKFANFEDYLAAHGGMTVPLPADASEPEETAKPAAEAAE